MCCLLSLCVFECAVCLYVCMYIQVCLLLPHVVFFPQLFSFWCCSVFLGIFELFVRLQLRPFALGEHARPSLGASASSLFLSFSVCVVGGRYFYFFCFRPVSVCLSVLLVLCLASACLVQTVTPTAGRECPPVKAPLKPLGLGCLLKPFIFPDSPGLGLVRQDTPP